MSSIISNRLRLGAVALAGCGPLIAVATILRGPFSDPTADPTAFAHWVSSPTFAPASFVFMAGLLFQIFGVITLYGYLIHTPAERWALWGMILTVSTDALLLALVGTFAYAFPSIGRLYLQGQKNVMEVVLAFGSSFIAVLLTQAILYSLAAIFMSVAIWRSGKLPKWSALVYLLAGLILAFAPPLPYLPELIGAILLAMSSVWIGWSIWRHRARGLNGDDSV